MKKLSIYEYCVSMILFWDIRVTLFGQLYIIVFTKKVSLSGLCKYYNNYADVRTNVKVVGWNVIISFDVAIKNFKESYPICRLLTLWIVAFNINL